MHKSATEMQPPLARPYFLILLTAAPVPGFYLQPPVTTLPLWFLLISSAPWVTMDSETEVEWMGGLNLSYTDSLSFLMELPSE